MTRGSDRNSLKYWRNAEVVGAVGVPRFTSSTAISFDSFFSIGWQSLAEDIDNFHKSRST